MSKKSSALGTVLKVTGGIVVGAAAGLVTGLLIAPKKGSETLEDIKDVTLKLKDDAEGKIAELKTGAEKSFNDFKEASDDKISALKTQLDEYTEKSEPVIINQTSDVVVEAMEGLNDEDFLIIEEPLKNKAEEVKEVVKESATTLDDSTESLLARIQGVTADTLDEE